MLLLQPILVFPEISRWYQWASHASRISPKDLTTQFKQCLGVWTTSTLQNPPPLFFLHIEAALKGGWGERREKENGASFVYSTDPARRQ